MDTQQALIVGALIGACITAITGALLLLLHHVLVLRADLIRRQRDREEQYRQKSLGEMKPQLTHAQTRELLARVRKELEGMRTSDPHAANLQVSETQVKEFLNTVNVDMEKLLSTVGAAGTIELLSIRIVRWLLERERPVVSSP